VAVVNDPFARRNSARSSTAQEALADSVQGLSGRSAEQRSRESAQYGVLFQKRSFKETNNKRATGMTNRPKVGLSFF